jgi:hypothetical protein
LPASASASASTDHGATSLTNGALPRTAAFPSWHPSRVSHPAKTETASTRHRRD